MKNIYITVVLLLLVFITKAQLEEDGIITYRYGGKSVLGISFYDARTTNPGAPGPPERIELTNVKVEIVIKKDTIRLYSGDKSIIQYTKPLKAKEIEIIISREGYHTLKEKWKVTSLSISLRAYLTKKEEENTKDKKLSPKSE